MAQQAVLQGLEPIFEPTFHPSSHGFRRGRGAPTAIAEVKAHLESGRQTVVDIDLSQFFDRVDHQRLMDRLAQKVDDARALALVRRMRRRASTPDGETIAVHEETPQGGPLSPLPIQIVEDDVGQERRQRASLRRAFVDGDRLSVRRHDARLQHPAHQGQHARIVHLLGEAIHQPLVVDAVEKLRQVDVHHRLAAGFQMRLDLGDRRGRAPAASKAVAARMEGRLEDWLQPLEHSLLRHPVRHIGPDECSAFALKCQAPEARRRAWG